MMQAFDDPLFAAWLKLPARTGQMEARPLPVLKPHQRLLISVEDADSPLSELTELLDAPFTLLEDAPPPLVLLHFLPPIQLLEALRRCRYELGVYLPGDTTATPLLPLRTPFRPALELLRRLHLLGAQPAALCEPHTHRDPFHLAQLIGPIAQAVYPLPTGSPQAAQLLEWAKS